MPSEFRRVMFTNNELIEAIHDYNEISQDELPPGIILTCTSVSQAESTTKSIQIHGDEVSLNVEIEGRSKRAADAGGQG